MVPPPVTAPTPPYVLAHRGGSSPAAAGPAENTVAAFRAARAAGADGVELDVRRSADGALVVHHDAEVPGAGLVARHPLAALRRARPDLATLEEALEACAGLLVDVEVKHLPGEPDFDPAHGPVRAVAAVLAGWTAGPVALTSFDPGALAAARDVTGALALGLVSAGAAPAAIARAQALGCTLVLPAAPLLADAPAFVAAAHAAGLGVVPWTCNDEAGLAAMVAAGVDGVVTDLPALARRVVGAGSPPRQPARAAPTAWPGRPGGPPGSTRRSAPGS